MIPWLNIDLARNGNSGCANEISGCANATSEGNPYENEIIGVILGCAISFIVRAKHECIVLASHPCTSVLHRQLSQLHTLKLPIFFHFRGDFHQNWHFAHPKISLAHPELPILAKSMHGCMGSWLILCDSKDLITEIYGSKPLPEPMLTSH